MNLFEKVGKEEYKNEKLTFLEKALIRASIPLFKVMLWKFKRVKTYGDLTKLGNTIETNLNSWEDKYQEIETEEQVEEFSKDLEKLEEKLKEIF